MNLSTNNNKYFLFLPVIKLDHKLKPGEEQTPNLSRVTGEGPNCKHTTLIYSHKRTLSGPGPGPPSLHPPGAPRSPRLNRRHSTNHLRCQHDTLRPHTHRCLPAPAARVRAPGRSLRDSRALRPRPPLGGSWDPSDRCHCGIQGPAAFRGRVTRVTGSSETCECAGNMLRNDRRGVGGS